MPTRPFLFLLFAAALSGACASVVGNNGTGLGLVRIPFAPPKAPLGLLEQQNGTVKGILVLFSSFPAPNFPAGNGNAKKLGSGTCSAPSVALRTDSGNHVPVINFGGHNESWVRKTADLQTRVEGDLTAGKDGIVRISALRRLPSPRVAEPPVGRSPSLGAVGLLVAKVTICGITPVISGAEMQNAVFGAWDSLANRFTACSHGRFGIAQERAVFLDINIGCPYPGIFTSGCPDNVPRSDGPGTATQHLEDLSYDLIKANGYAADDTTTYRFAILIWPEAAQCGWWAHAYMNWARMTILGGPGFNQGLLMHEAGHNLGLDHSGASDDDYDNVSELGGGARCLNSAEHWALGWDDPEEPSLQGKLAPGGVILKALPNFVTSATASLKIALPSYPGWSFYTSFAADSDMNAGDLKASVANNLIIILWDQPRFKESYPATQRWGNLKAGSAPFEYDDLVIRHHAVHSVGSSKSAIVSVCRKTNGFDCSGSAAQMTLGPSGAVAFIAIDLQAVAYGVKYADALDCYRYCVDQPGCLAWTLDTMAELCWVVEKQLSSTDPRTAAGYISGFVRTTPVFPATPSPPPPVPTPPSPPSPPPPPPIDNPESQFTVCGDGMTCCETPVSTIIADTASYCESECSTHPTCYFMNYDAATRRCRMFRTCGRWKDSPGSRLGAYDPSLASCPETKGCPTPKVGIRVTLTNTSVKQGRNVSLRARVTRSDNGRPIRGITVVFIVNGSSVGSARTNNQGVATRVYRYPAQGAVGRRTWRARFKGSSTHNSGSGSGRLTVSR